MVAVLSFGSCMGDSAALVRRAEDAVAAIPGIRELARSSLYETEAVDVPEQFADVKFVNAVAAYETSLAPEGLSLAVHGVEDSLGRKRSGLRHEPRTMDIDIVVCGDELRDSPELRLPHPEAARRRFVMEPLAEIMPGFILPGQSRTALEIASSLPPRPAARRLP
ncbi:MAG: 2-amino-4-hydroxy-6-hydroxymethyldihydropteridine diphosphokinase [Kiritimatiellae bacterium]|nr:2-amino-4-hydroxy-6-hydroxymethyldihydropteridine diphosphokinase [Kiritimatiellia bacterium]